MKEGTKISSYIFVDKEAVKYIVDASRDEFGSQRIHIYDCGKISNGSYEFNKEEKAMVFKPLSREEPAENTPFFQCGIENENLIF